MKIILGTIVILIALVLIITIIGLLLPKERIVSRQSVYRVSPKKLFEVVTDNSDWKYRTGLKDLIIIESTQDKEVWDEVQEDGSVIRFNTREKRPYSFYSFDMESKIFTGYWTAEFIEKGENYTLFVATEHISVKNPFIKTISYLFFDIGKLMDVYQQDLKKRIN